MAADPGLSAPEALVLMSLPRFDARKAIKIGLLALLLQGVLRLDVEERPGLLRKRQTVRLRAIDTRPSLPGASASLVAVVRAAEPAGVMSDVVKQAAREYGRALTGFVQNHVMPELVRRGLAEPRRQRLLGLFPITRWHPTVAGEVERRRLQSVTRQARAIPDFLNSDPAQAVALAAAAGSALLLVDELKPHYQRLSQAMRPPDGGDFSGSLDLSAWPEGGEASRLEGAAEFNLGTFDLTAFDSFDAGFAAFDAGFDAAADAGGDGGGDGGSSGC